MCMSTCMGPSERVWIPRKELVTDSCELPNLGAKSKSRGLTHIVHVHIFSENKGGKKINL